MWFQIVWFFLPQHNNVLNTTVCDKVCEWLVAGRWFSPGTLVSFTNKIDHKDIAETFLKVALISITVTLSKLQYTIIIIIIIIIRPNKKICVFTVTCQKSFYYRQNWKWSFPVPESNSSISFSKFPVSRHLLKLFYDELRSFSTFFALNFDKKLAVE